MSYTREYKDDSDSIDENDELEIRRPNGSFTDEDREFFEETDDDNAERREASLIDNMGSTEELGGLLDERESNNIKPEEFGLKVGKGKNIYCDKQELYEEIRKYQQDGVATNALGEMLIKIALHMSTMARFWRYSHDIKEELVSNAIAQMFKSVPKFNLKDSKKNPFGYLSMICYRDMLHSLKKHFKPDKIVKAVTEAHISKLSNGNQSDEILTMLKTTLERNEEYNNFLKNERYPYPPKQVDTFALSRREQRKQAKLEARAAKKASKGNKKSSK